MDPELSVSSYVDQCLGSTDEDLKKVGEFSSKLKVGCGETILDDFVDFLSFRPTLLSKVVQNLIEEELRASSTFSFSTQTYLCL